MHTGGVLRTVRALCTPFMQRCNRDPYFVVLGLSLLFGTRYFGCTSKLGIWHSVVVAFYTLFNPFSPVLLHVVFRAWVLDYDMGNQPTTSTIAMQRGWTMLRGSLVHGCTRIITKSLVFLKFL